MKNSKVSVCLFCGGGKRGILNYGDFPLAPRATLEPRIQTFDFVIGLCNSCGLIQIMNPAEPSVLYEEFKNDIIGAKLGKHKAAFKDFLKRFVFENDKLFEVGAGGGGAC